MTNAEEIKITANNLKTQDNRRTDQPMFVVQTLVRDIGYGSGYADDFIWINEDCDEVDAEDPGYDDDDLDSFSKVYYKERWEFVTACFTQAACADYIDRMKHRHSGEMRIYAEGSYRNYEYQAVRTLLMNLN